MPPLPTELSPRPACFLSHRPRRLEPVCSGLQAQILHCYRNHLHEVLLCSDLVKAYQHCVSTAHKVKSLDCWVAGGIGDRHCGC